MEKVATRVGDKKKRPEVVSPCIQDGSECEIVTTFSAVDMCGILKFCILNASACSMLEKATISTEIVMSRQSVCVWDGVGWCVCRSAW